MRQGRSFITRVDSPRHLGAGYEHGYATDVVRYDIGLGLDPQDTTVGPGYYMTIHGVVNKGSEDPGDAEGQVASVEEAHLHSLLENYGGYHVSLKISMTTNFDDATLVHLNTVAERPPYGGPSPWGELVTVAGCGTVPLRISLDMAIGESWMCGDLDLAAARALPGDGAWDGADAATRSWYESKLFVPVLPELDAETRVEQYPGDMVAVSLSPTRVTLVSMEETTGAPVSVGVATGFTPAALRVFEDGVLALGRRPGGETFTGALRASGAIAVQRVYITFGHDRYDRRYHLLDYVCFGEYLVYPLCPEPGEWIAVPVDAHAIGAGWVVLLEKITFRSRGTTTEYDAGFAVRVDCACSQTYLPLPLANALLGLNVARGAAARGCAGQFAADDEVEFHFAGGVRAAGQARRFFVSPMRYWEAHTVERGYADACAVRASAGGRYYLGMNFFRTFVVGLDDSEETGPRILLSTRQGGDISA